MNRTAKPPGKRAVRSKPAVVQAGTSRLDPAVDAFLDALKHPLKPALQQLRQLILDVSPDIREGIKWNSPSFRTADWFATINVHGGGRLPRPKAPPALRMILHNGAKTKASATTGLKIADPAGLLQWLAKDRALVTIGSQSDFAAGRAALHDIIRAWIKQL